MRRIALPILIAAIALSLTAGPLRAEETVAAPVVTIHSAQVSGVSENVVTITYHEGKRKVYDPVMIAEGTVVLRQGKPVPFGTIRVRQYVNLKAVRQGDSFLARELTILGGAPTPKPKAKVSVKPKPKVVLPKPHATR